MLKYLQNFFQSLLNAFSSNDFSSSDDKSDNNSSSKEENIDDHSQIQEEEKRLKISQEESSTSGSNVLKLKLVRYSNGANDVLGKLYLDDEWVCYTLEGKQGNHLPVNRYVLGLRKEGGYHGTYAMKFKEKHLGMLWVRGAKEYPYSTIHMGNTAPSFWGDIIVGTSIQNETDAEKNRELWHSDQAYLLIYPRLSDFLLNGRRIELAIEETYTY